MYSDLVKEARTQVHERWKGGTCAGAATGEGNQPVRSGTQFQELGHHGLVKGTNAQVQTQSADARGEIADTRGETADIRGECRYKRRDSRSAAYRTSIVQSTKRLSGAELRPPTTSLPSPSTSTLALPLQNASSFVGAKSSSGITSARTVPTSKPTFGVLSDIPEAVEV
jgi:hypothetical protein